MIQSNSETEVSCTHCGLPVPAHRRSASSFCCGGCEGVYNYINAAGLSDFYRLRTEVWAKGTAIRLENSNGNFAILDRDAATEKFTEMRSSGVRRVRFSLEGIHCAACVWLIEKLPAIISGVERSTVNIISGSCEIEYRNVPLSVIAAALRNLGYNPRPLPRGCARKHQSDRSSLMRIGVAAASAMNTMLFAVSIYQGWFTGMDQRFVNLFNWLSLLIALPAVAYAGVPLYRTALLGLRTRTLHIDLPLSIAILIGFTLSVYNTISGGNQVYYDTLTMLIFLILSARWLQSRCINQAVERSGIFASLFPLSAQKQVSSGWQSVLIEELNSGDVIKVERGDCIPADGTVLLGSSALDRSVLTGESESLKVVAGETVFGGTRNLESTLLVQLESDIYNSRIGKLVELIEQAGAFRPKLALFTDRVSALFVGAVVTLALCGGAYWYFQSGPTAALNVVLSLLVVSCPCALGLAVPLAFALATKRGAEAGVLIKSADAVERFARAKCFCFDKTGTLTTSNVTVLDSKLSSDCDERSILNAVAALELGSQHPVGRALREFALSKGAEPVSDWNNSAIPGRGVCATKSDQRWLLGSEKLIREELPSMQLPLHAEGDSLSHLVRDDKLLASFKLSNTLRPEMKSAVEQLQIAGKRISVLSGDRFPAVAKVCAELGISDFQAELLPEQKVAHVLALSAAETTAMIGDGANDAAALQAAAVGVGVSGGAEVCLEVADIYLVTPSALSALIRGAKSTMRAVRINLGISLVYNSTGAALALSGLMNPLLAAIIMPLSSLTVVGVALLLVRFGTSDAATGGLRVWR